jgi:D-aspartate ligase
VIVSGKRRLHFASAGIASPALRTSSRAPDVALAPSLSRSPTTTVGKAFDTRIGAFVLGMNETGLTAVRCLGREGITVKGFDIAAKRAGFRSRYCTAEVCPDPLHQPDDLVRFLRHQVRDESQKVVLLPTSDLFFLFLSRHRVQLADRFLMNLPSVEVAESVVNKRGLYELAAANDTPFPESYFPGTYDEALAVKDSLRYPAFIKPYWGHQWRRHFGGLHKGFKVQSSEEFLARFREVLDSGHPALVQSYVTSPDDNLFSLSLYISQAGEPLAVFPRKQVRQYPPNSGTVSLAISERNPELVANGTQFCQSIGYRGIAGLEYKLDREDQQYKLLDFNPRLMLSDSLTAYCGINLPLMQYLDLTSQRPAPRPEYPEGVKWLDSIADFHSFKQYHERGELGFKDWLNSLRGAKVFALFAWDDPLPFLVERKFGLSYGRILQYAIRLLSSTFFVRFAGHARSGLVRRRGRPGRSP